jgi:hypothetical protein
MDILSLYIPILVSLLVEDSDILKGRSLRTNLHNHVLSTLLVIAPQFPQAFRMIMEQYPMLKKRLEQAIKGQQATHKTTPSTVSSNSDQSVSRVIKLKTDFSNFK